MRARVSALLILVCLVATLGAAQDRGTIAGKVTDDAGAVIPGATVTLTGPENRKAVSNEKGEFVFVGRAAGRAINSPWSLRAFQSTLLRSRSAPANW